MPSYLGSSAELPKLGLRLGIRVHAPITDLMKAQVTSSPMQPARVSRTRPSRQHAESCRAAGEAAADALHIALAAVNGKNFLVTWNCTHIANWFVLQSVNNVCRDAGFEPPIVCTPEELMEG